LIQINILNSKFLQIHKIHLHALKNNMQLILYDNKMVDFAA